MSELNFDDYLAERKAIDAKISAVADVEMVTIKASIKAISEATGRTWYDLLGLEAPGATKPAKVADTDPDKPIKDEIRKNFLGKTVYVPGGKPEGHKIIDRAMIAGPVVKHYKEHKTLPTEKLTKE